MENRFYIYLLALMMVSNAGFCGASTGLTGLYKGPGRWVVELTEDGPNGYQLIYGDIIERAKNNSNSKLSVCLAFDFVDILVPKRLAVNVEEECLGSVVAVDKYFSEIKFGNAQFKDIYLLTISRSGIVKNPEGVFKKVPGGKKTFEILYSENSGLIGFRKLPSNREDFFIIDWRSLEKRSKK